MIDFDFPSFKPHPFIRNAHLQTAVATWFPGSVALQQTVRREVLLDDGDRIVLHDDCPDEWRDGDRFALLVHGLGGSHRSGYMARTAAKLYSRGIRAMRMDLRGCGAGFDKARGSCHAGKYDDVVAVLNEIKELCPGATVTLVGFSMAGNVALYMAGQLAGQTPVNLDRIISVAPPIDLMACGINMRQWHVRPYDWAFTRSLRRQVDRRRQFVPDYGDVDVRQLPRRLWEFDDLYTSQLFGFDGAEDYYRKCSSAHVLKSIQLPTQIVTAADDPVIPVDMFKRVELSPSVALHVTEYGGHVGFVGVKGVDPDRRWLDWRIVDWVAGHHFNSRPLIA
ncbi:MAG: alpha/beta fold hydrolase [Planctomycetes bacterium]|nr:alpha/beta fold hydrolase [Planctomycetota bacterium]